MNEERARRRQRLLFKDLVGLSLDKIIQYLHTDLYEF